MPIFVRRVKVTQEVLQYFKVPTEKSMDYLSKDQRTPIFAVKESATFQQIGNAEIVTGRELAMLQQVEYRARDNIAIDHSMPTLEERIEDEIPF